MLNFDLEIDENVFKLKCFTNVDWIKKKFKNKELKFIDEYEKSDICIVDSNFKFKDKTRDIFKINIDELNDNVDTFIGRDYVEGFLDMIEKNESEDYGVGMADFTDIKMVAKGRLIEYLKLTLNNNDEEERIEEFRKSLKSRETCGGGILFVTRKKSKIIYNYYEILSKLYSNINIVLIAPCKMLDNIEHYVELFVFDGQTD